jgi:uncharacterized RDD family membrane protein YckC
MRCPKCHYISFDSHERCRNCGYEFSLTVDSKSLDLPIHTGEEAFGPLRDLALTDLDGPNVRDRKPSGDAPDPVGSAPAIPSVSKPHPITTPFDLPLFKDRAFDDDRPLVTPAAVPRAPLSVRRSNPVITRGGARIAVDEPVLDLDAPPPAPSASVSAHASPDAPIGSPEVPSAPAGAGLRLLAAIVDGVILGAISAVVVYFTLMVCGLQLSELAILPRVPFATFLLLVGGGYFTLFTAAGGQTIGKMTAGIKVVSVHCESPWSARVPLADSVLRAIGYVVSALPAGLGFLPALFGTERRAVHDRLADTRVVKA